MLETDDEELSKISQKARLLWGAYLEEHKLEPSDIFLKRKQPRHIFDFFTFCGEINSPQLGGSAIIEQNIVPAKLMDAANSNARSVSWLVWFNDSEGAECPVMLLDFDFLNSNLNDTESTRKQLELVLHETGHLILHGGILRNADAAHNHAASAKLEAEAWWFCHSILGWSIATIAHNHRAGEKEHGDFDDEIWRYNFPYIK